MNPIRIAFFGTAALACPVLDALTRHPDFRVVSVITQPDRPAGRGLHPQPSPVKVRASELELPIDQPERCRDPLFLERFKSTTPDLAIVVAFGQILPRILLDLLPRKFLNVHASLLPKYRGAAPIQWAILNGDTQTGVTIMLIDEGLDTGDILSTRVTPILDTDNAITLHDRLAQMGAQLLLETIQSLPSGRIQPTPQPHSHSSYARKITRADGCLDWTSPAESLWNKCRALVPWPGTYTLLPHTEKRRLLKVWEAKPLSNTAGTSPPGQIFATSAAGIDVACGHGALRLLTVQSEGGRRMSAADFLAGHPIRQGQYLG